MQLLPLDSTTPVQSIGDAGVNTGIFVRSVLKNKPAGGTYVLCVVESFTFQSYLDLWGEATGFAKEKGSATVVTISYDDYRSLWPGFGDLMGEMNAFWSSARDRSWETPLGTMPVDARDIMSAEDKQALQSTATSFQLDVAEYKKAIH